ncbi:UPF0149 family protein [Pseudoalteromonas sp. T1lg22]|uniref:UPF0149 family protein n=1 Tax=Pseudoalteromonas sp. T1lg22 TaxID=2077096 RepID=UPI000CF6F892|nr:UPF0149 family protein [Pseudoalteromonas sp. T1lg22]
MSEQALTSLRDYLKEAGNAMPLAQVQGYLFALICAPAPIEEEQWLQEVLGGHAADCDESVLFALMSLHQDISEQVYETGFKLTSNVAVAQRWQDNLAADAELHQWAQGFVLGVSYYLEPLLSAPSCPEESKDMLAQAVTVLGLFADAEQFSIHAANSGQDEQAFNDALVDMMADFSLGFAELIELTAVQSGLFDDEPHWET